MIVHFARFPWDGGVRCPATPRLISKNPMSPFHRAQFGPDTRSGECAGSKESTGTRNDKRPCSLWGRVAANCRAITPATLSLFYVCNGIYVLCCAGRWKGAWIGRLAEEKERMFAISCGLVGESAPRGGNVMGTWTVCGSAEIRPFSFWEKMVLAR